MSSTTPADESAFPRRALIALAAAILVSTTCEFLPGGLIPLISAEFGRSAADVGWLVTGFAIAIIVSATPLTLVTRRLRRKHVMIGALALFGIVNLATAAAPSFELLAAARVVGGMAHGLFFSVLFVYPAHLVAPDKLARATSITALGGALAGIIGVPVGNALGQFIGWRMGFAVFGLLILVVCLMLWRVLPHIGLEAPPREGAWHRDPSWPLVLALCGVIVVVVTGQVSFGTYSAVWLIDVAGFPGATIPLVLFISGAAGVIGVLAKARMADGHPRSTFVINMSVIVVTFVALALSVRAGAPWIAILLAIQGAAFAGVPVLLQTRMMQLASVRLRSVAASLQATAFNVGIGGGAFTGGIVIERAGVAALPLGAGAIVLVGVACAAATEIIAQRRSRR